MALLGEAVTVLEGGKAVALLDLDRNSLLEVGLIQLTLQGQHRNLVFTLQSATNFSFHFVYDDDLNNDNNYSNARNIIMLVSKKIVIFVLVNVNNYCDCNDTTKN